MNIRFAACGSNGMYPTSSQISSGMSSRRFELVLEPSLALGLGEQGDPLGRSPEDDALAGHARTDPQGDREMGLAGAGWSEEHDILAGVQEVELPEVLDDLLLDRALEGEVKLLERLARREPCRTDPGVPAVSVTGRCLG